MAHLSEKQVLLFLVEFGLLLLTSRVLADLMKRMGQASVIGELCAGLVLGPSLLGHFAPAAYRWLFPGDPLTDHLLEVVAWIGVILLLLYTGLETDLDILRSVGRRAAIISISGIVIPLLTGFGLGWYLPAAYLASPNQRVIFALFMAVAMSISAVPVIAKILIDLDLMRRDLGLLILAAGMLDDTVGWLLLSIVAGLAARGSINLSSLALTLAAVIAFLGFCYLVGFRLVQRILRWVDDRGVIEHGTLSAIIGIGLGCAIITQAIGIHAVFGAFVAGLMLSSSARVRSAERTELEALTLGVLAPVFFAYSGLRADLFAVKSPQLLLAVLGVATAGKLIGCTAGGLISALGWRESFAVASGMNARGGMEIVVALIGLSLGILTPEVYTVIILMAIVTSFIAPSMLTAILSGVGEKAEEAERLQREKILSRAPFSKEGARLLVLTAGGPHANLAVHLAAAIGNHHDASITLFHAITPAAGEGKDFQPQFAALKQIAEQCGARNVYSREGSAATVVEAILAESKRGYDAIFAGASHLTRRDLIGGDVLSQVIQASAAPFVITRAFEAAAPEPTPGASGNGHLPFRQVLAPVTGATFSRLGATMAMLYGQAVEAQVTALYVMENPTLMMPRLVNRSRSRRSAEEIVSEIQQLGEQLGVAIKTEVGAGSRPESVIVRTVERQGINLLVMGVLYRSSEQRLYFGPKVEQILSRARCAVALVVPAENAKV